MIKRADPFWTRENRLARVRAYGKLRSTRGANDPLAAAKLMRSIYKLEFPELGHLVLPFGDMITWRDGTRIIKELESAYDFPQKNKWFVDGKFIGTPKA